jgi:hypothetical protein
MLEILKNQDAIAKYTRAPRHTISSLAAIFFTFYQPTIYKVEFSTLQDLVPFPSP